MVTLRPEGYFSRIRSSIRSIYETLLVRLTRGAWGTPGLRQRAGHWLRRFVEKVRMDWTDASDLKVVLRFCYEKQIPFFI